MTPKQTAPERERAFEAFEQIFNVHRAALQVFGLVPSLPDAESLLETQPTDVKELERMLADAGGSAEQIKKAAEENFGLGIFIRSLVGMEREAVSQAFSGLIAGTNATPDQIEFIELIVTELTANGTMEARRLYESPFLDISPQGPEGLFPVAKVEKMVQMLDEIAKRAVG